MKYQHKREIYILGENFKKKTDDYTNYNGGLIRRETGEINMDYKDLANLIFPDAKEISYYEEKYPERN